MSEKKVKFDEDSLVDQFENDQEEVESRLKKGKHSLDSDEDDDEDVDKYDMMKEDDIEGQEDGTIDFDDDIQITPFNMKDEMEEGHFDKDGTYIFDKSKNIRDNWIENIDWLRIKESERQKAQAMIDAREAAEEAELPPVDRVAVYKEMLEVLQPQESVAKALRRLGKSKGKKLTTAQRWKAKRQKTENGGAGVEQEEPNKGAMLRLTEMADQLVQNGMMEIYDATREKIGFLLKQTEDKDRKKLAIADNMDDDDALDMFADNFDQKAADETKSGEEGSGGGGGGGGGGGDGGEGRDSKKESAETSMEAESSSSQQEEGNDGSVRWEYKVQNTEASPVLGPYTSSQMLTFVEEEKFKDAVYCRKVSAAQGQFYSSSRIDFDLYI